MAELKTKVNDASVSAFINTVEDEQKRKDAKVIVKMMEEVTGEKAKMWGDAIIGCGKYHYKYDSGHEGDMPVAGFSPRKQSLTIYIMHGFPKYEALMAKLGKHTTSKACLYIKKLADVDTAVLKQIIAGSVAQTKKTYK